jgi:hypothetical protein
MKRFVCGLIAAATLTGCSAGQQAQTAAMEPAVNGSSATSHNIALRDVRIRAVQTGDALNPGKNVDLVLVVANQQPDTSDKLLGVTQDIGQLNLIGDTTVPPSGTLLVGDPDRAAATALSEVSAAKTAKATITLTKAISNGLLYNFTFHFAQAGDITLAVPIAAGVDAPRQNQQTPR